VLWSLICTDATVASPRETRKSTVSLPIVVIAVVLVSTQDRGDALAASLHASGFLATNRSS